ncbi:histidine kinase [Novosphingobium sp.]|uniref:histidine kinase n=1 Tax=Novosphingobium sp. TaxID=1874826 RepID=UPI003BAB9F3C
MKTTTKVLATALALGSAMALGGTASAHDWRGNGWGYAQPYGGGWQGDRGDFGGTCSGQRGYGLERQLRWQVNRGRIDGWTAQRIQGAIDKLQWKEQHECSEGDWRAVGKISRDYDRIGDWIARESGGYWGR